MSGFRTRVPRQAPWPLPAHLLRHALERRLPTGVVAAPPVALSKCDRHQSHRPALGGDMSVAKANTTASVRSLPISAALAVFQQQATASTGRRPDGSAKTVFRPKPTAPVRRLPIGAAEQVVRPKAVKAKSTVRRLPIGTAVQVVRPKAVKAKGSVLRFLIGAALQVGRPKAVMAKTSVPPLPISKGVPGLPSKAMLTGDALLVRIPKRKARPKAPQSMEN
jgi:hypothetical protein